MPPRTLILGQTLAFTDDPFQVGIEAATRFDGRGGVLVEDGRIADLGGAEDLRHRHRDAEVRDMGKALILPGFVDAHAHYPQTAMIASWGKRLIDWLNDYTFPEEMRFADPDHAAHIAARYLDLLLAHGTTTVSSYCTIHPGSAEALFEAAEARGMRIVAGKTCMDRNAPEGLRDTPQSAYDDSKRLLEKWHGRGRLGYAITPRFSPTSTPDQLAALGALWAEHPECLMQTHLSEQTDEIEWVLGLFPGARDYLDTYEQFGLLGGRGVYGHAIHLTDRERARLAETGAGLVHCPTSNTFIGSGLFDMGRAVAERQRVGLATDTGGGSSFSMLRTMAAAYEIGQLAGTPIHPAELLWLATGGAARVLHLEDRIGRLAIGAEADLVALDLASTPAIAQRAAEAGTLWEAVFPTIMMGDDRAVAQVWVAGRAVG
ncbi:guanine deaminase [Maritimibacter sp. 55A14]|uniref:guanine deaminase n=1 Tax=Maritimibacter sp. 55A14 TaxID=2174844 RepID=UPI000D6136DC|nr:guanine deaminase [Maritimibacter sp. 55A14]PWE28881.1 guanine deaminase [Maritimibacter sp. 55A14]